MKAIETIIERMRARRHSPAIFWKGREYTYGDLFLMIEQWHHYLQERGVAEGVVCGFIGEYSPQVCALIFALLKTKGILVPLTPANEHELPEFIKIAGVTCLFTFDSDDNWVFETYDAPEKNNIIETFKEREVPGLIVFTSGSTGKPKGILHDCERVLRKFIEERPGWRTVLFLMLDHFGGFNTMLSAFAYNGTAVCLLSRSPESVCSVIQASQATLLPTTPTFINLLIASRCYKEFDLSSIKLITYGTEVMPASTLKKLQEIFPNARVKQTYGLSELGVLRSRSENDNSLWVKIGGDGFETKIVDGMLWVRSEANMVGYLNAPNPFDEDGWMCTGDHVETRGDFVRILGRKSEIINVGGQKVFPSEIENILLEAENIREVAVVGIPHPVMGNVVKAKISLCEPEEPFELKERLRKYCLQRLAKHKVPVKFEIVDEGQLRNMRFKKRRENLS